MLLFRKILADREEEKRKRKLANPCKHKKFKPFVWNGQTTCSECCKHKYKDFLETDDGSTTCTLLVKSSWVGKGGESQKA